MNTCSVALVEFYADGHHGPYLQDLVSGLNETPASVKVIGSPDLDRFVPAGVLCPIRGCEQLIGKQGVRRQWVARELFGNAITQAMISGSTHMHFLYADWHVSAIAAAWRQMQPLSTQPVLTVHWTAGVGAAGGVKDKLRRYPHRLALRWLVDRAGACVLVHHESVASGLSDIIDRNRVYVVPYPSRPLFASDSIEQSRFRANRGLTEEDRLMLCFGDTRFDKGADLAVQMLKKLPSNFHLLIAGKPQHFQPDDLRRQVEALDVADRLHLIPRFLSDSETALAFHASDMVLLPYRRTFSGQSGPLTQAAAIGKPVVVADLAVLAETVRAFHLGMVSPPEDIEAMAEAIQSAAQWRPDPMDTAAFVTHHSPQVFARAVYENYLKAGSEGNKP